MACLLVLAGALIAGLTIDDVSGGDGWKFRAKLVGLSGIGLGIAITGGIAVGAALAVGAMLAAGSGAPLAGAARMTVGLGAAWLLVVATIAVVVDVTFFGEADDALGYVLGGTLSDLGAAVLAAAALLLVTKSSR